MSASLEQDKLSQTQHTYEVDGLTLNIFIGGYEKRHRAVGLGSKCVTAACNDVLTQPIPDQVTLTSELIAEKDAETLVVDGAKLTLLSYFDTTNSPYKELTKQVVKGREAAYKSHKIWNPETEAQDDLLGPNVEIVALVDPSSGETLASLRLVHGPLGQLPTYAKLLDINGLSQDGEAFLMQSGRDRSIVEVAAFWKADSLRENKIVEFALYRKAMLLALRERAILLIGAVPMEARSLSTIFSEDVIHNLGEKIRVKDGNAKNGLELIPLAIDTLTCFAEQKAGISRIREKIASMSVRDEETRKLYMSLHWRNAMMAYFRKGVDGDSSITDETRRMLDERARYDDVAA